jgi:anti-sigma factor RsiW
VTECEVTRRALHAYVDGELVGEERQAVESHLQSCAACRRAHENEVALVAAVREALPRPAAPDALRQRVERLTAPETARSRRHWLVAALAAGVTLLAIAFTTRTRAPLPQRPEEFVSVAVDSHLRYVAGRLPLEVRTAQPESVSRFFAGRVPFNLTLPDYQVGPGEEKFYELEGARLVALTGDYAAYVAYRMDGRSISLLVASADKVHPAGRETVRSGALTFHQDAVAGLNVITWIDKGLGYALVSDLSVTGERSCLVCHGSPSERKKIPGFAPRS